MGTGGRATASDEPVGGIARCPLSRLTRAAVDQPQALLPVRLFSGNYTEIEAIACQEIGDKGLGNDVMRRYGLRVRTCAMDRNMQNRKV